MRIPIEILLAALLTSSGARAQQSEQDERSLLAPVADVLTVSPRPVPGVRSRVSLVHDPDRSAPYGAEPLLSMTARPETRFAAELRHQAQSSRAAVFYGNVAEAMPDLQENDLSRHQRSRAARQVIGSTLGTFIGRLAFQRDAVRPRRSDRQDPVTVKMGFQLDASPEWTVRRQGQGTGLKLSLPLTPGAVRLKYWRDAGAPGRNRHSLSMGISIDPFDRTIHCGFSFEI